MADRIELNAGTGGAILATDEVTKDTVLQHVQFVKLMSGAADSIDVIPGNATDGMLVNLGANNDVTVTGNVAVTNSGITTIAGAVAGTEMQVDVVAALPAGTNNIGDVDVLSVIPGNGATNLGKAVDDVAGATDTGIAILAVRDDSLTTLTPIDGDYTPLRVSSTGALHVTGGGGGTEYTEDIATPATIVGTATMMERDDALAALTPIEGDWAAMRCDANGALWTAVNNTVTIADGGGSLTVDNTTLSVTGGGLELGALRVTIANDSTGVVSIDDNGGSITVDGSVSVTGTVTVDSELTTADLDTGAGTDIRAVVGLVGSASGGGALIPGSTTDGLLVNLGANNDVTVTGTVTANLAAGTNNIGDVDILSIAAGDNNIGNVDIVTMPNVTLAAGTNTNEVVGDVAHDAAAAGNPVSVSGVAQTMDDTAPPNRVSAESDATRIATSLDGGVFVHPHGPQVWSYHSNGSTALTDASVHAAPGAGLSLYVTDIVISSGAATAMSAFFEEGASTVLGPYYLEAVAGRGVGIHFQTPKKITANTALTVTTSAAIAHSVDITGFTAPS